MRPQRGHRWYHTQPDHYQPPLLDFEGAWTSFQEHDGWAKLPFMLADLFTMRTQTAPTMYDVGAQTYLY